MNKKLNIFRVTRDLQLRYKKISTTAAVIPVFSVDET